MKGYKVTLKITKDVCSISTTLSSIEHYYLSESKAKEEINQNLNNFKNLGVNFKQRHENQWDTNDGFTFYNLELKEIDINE